MAIPDETVVREVLDRQNRGTLCRRAVEDALTRVNGDYPNLSWYRRKSTKRALVWEHSVENAIAALGDSRGVSIVHKDDTCLFVLDDTVVLKFKKANRQLISSNYPTISSLFFHKHDKDLFGHSGHHRVEVVHVFDRFEINIDWVGIVARNGRKVLWNFELPAGGAIIEQFPVAPKSSPAADRVLRPVKSEASKSDENERE